MNQALQVDNHLELAHLHQVFFDECAEHLAEMERILLEIDPAAPDGEQLNALFRAAHSIKGGAGIFGFADMSELTHYLESLLDRIRNNESPITREAITLFLEAADAVALQLAGHRDGAAVDGDAVADVSRKLIACCDFPSPQDNRVPPLHFKQEEPAGEVRSFEIKFAPAADTFLRGVRIENLFQELAGLGTLTTAADLPELPPLEEVDPEQCLLRWRLTLVGACSENDIRDIFEFVDGELEISEPISAPPEREEPAPSLMGRRAYDRDEMAPGAFGRRGGDGQEAASIRVGVAKVDQLINQVGELVITQAMLAQAASGLDPVLFDALHKGLSQLERNTRSLQESAMSMRLVPIRVVFSRFHRMVRDLSAKLGKEVRLLTSGDSTELDKGLVEKIADPLTHLVRNCLDHGIEPPEKRLAAGKEPTGTIFLRAAQLGGRIMIEVSDDGGGLNRERILKRAEERDIPVNPQMADEEVWQLIFAPGFSTAEVITDISGRGVGMDVVLKNIHSLGGKVQVTSEQGKGTKVVLSLPLTLAILDGISVAVGAERFIIPLTAIIESFQPVLEDIRTIGGIKELAHVRGEYLPLIRLHELFRIGGAIVRPEEGIVVLLDTDRGKVALLADALVDEHQVVIKSLEANYRKVPFAAGATIMGDGRVALILDVGEMADAGKRHISKEEQLYGTE